MNEYNKNWCLKVISELLKWPTTSVFRAPVDVVRDQAPNYYEIVKNPMDFSTMKKKLNNNEYFNVQEFVDDIKLICDNAVLFNGKMTIFGFICEDIMNEVKKMVAEKASSEEEEWFYSLNKAIKNLENHVKDVPYEVLKLPPTELPEYSLDNLNESQMSDLTKMLSKEHVNDLATYWPFFEEEKRKSIVAIINRSNNPENVQ